MSQLVLLLLLVPLAGGLVTLFVRNAGHKFARNLALGFFLLNLLSLLNLPGIICLFLKNILFLLKKNLLLFL